MILITMLFGTVLLNCQVTEDTISVGEYGYLVFLGRVFNPDFYNVQRDSSPNSMWVLRYIRQTHPSAAADPPINKEGKL